MALLEVRSISVAYDSVPALKGVSLDVDRGELAVVLGANGAGKTSLLRALSGLVSLEDGSVTFDGKDILQLAAHQRVAMGLAHVLEGHRVLGGLTVAENLILGAYLARRDKREVTARLGRVLEAFPRLQERMRQQAGTLSGGEQQMLAIARALMSDPAFLMIDEASFGLAPTMVEQLFEILESIHRAGTTLLIVEQNAYVSLELASHAYVLERGEVVFQGSATEIRENPRLLEAYLGNEAIHYQ